MKIPQHDFRASEPHHTEKIVDVILPTRNQATKPLQPSEEPFRPPAPPSRVHWLVFFPAVILATVLFALNFLGDGLRDALDPRQRQ